MNATELFLADQRSAGIYFCSECRHVKRTAEEANACCGPYTCSYCGVDVPRKNFRTACPDCIAKNEVIKEAARFEAAKKVTDHDGWIYAEGIGYNDGFFEDVAALAEWIEGEDDPELQMPAYVWTCDAIHFAQVSIAAITEHIVDNGDAYEDFEADDLHGLDKLEAAIVEFNQANAAIVSWQPNYKQALLVDPKFANPTPS